MVSALVLLVGRLQIVVNHVRMICLVQIAAKDVNVSTVHNAVRMMVIVCVKPVGWEIVAKKVSCIYEFSTLANILSSINVIMFLLVCPEGYYGLHCIEQCNCPSARFQCHVAEGCVCRQGYEGKLCDIPKSQQVIDVQPGNYYFYFSIITIIIYYAAVYR